MSAPLTLELPSNILISGRMLEMIKIFSDLYNPQSDFTFLGGSYSVQRKMGNYLMRLLALNYLIASVPGFRLPDTVNQSVLCL